MDPNAPVTNEQALARMVSRMQANQEHFKHVLESQAKVAHDVV